MFDGLLDYLKEHLPQKIIDGGYNCYEIFGKEAETPISDTIEEYLKAKGISYIPHRSTNKNEFPDLELEIQGTKFAMEYKVGIHSNKGDIEDSAANDMGTINAYPKKVKKYGDNIYCTFVKYSVLNDDTIDIEDIFFDKMYTFIGKRSDGEYLSYREKDGNLRPKNWDDMSNGTTYFHTREEFQRALETTSKFRSERIVLKHLDNLDETSLKNIKNYVDQKIDQIDNQGHDE